MKQLLETPSTYAGPPRWEGCNIRTWIGFKHLHLLAEEAVLHHFRQAGFGPARLFHEFGLQLTFTESALQLPRTVEADDTVRITVRPRPADGEIAFGVTAEHADAAVFRGTVRATLRPGGVEIPVDWKPFTSAEIAAEPGSVSGFAYEWRIPYYYCQFSEEIQLSGYLRSVEEAVDRYLHQAGLPIGGLLRSRHWIPVVSRNRIKVLAPAYMEETMTTALRVTEVIKDVMYSADVDFLVHRGGELLRTATASILHGYAVSAGPEAGTLAVFDPEVRSMLEGNR